MHLLIASLVAETDVLDRAAPQFLALVEAGQSPIKDKSFHGHDDPSVELEVDHMSRWGGTEVLGANILQQYLVDSPGREGIESSVPEPVHVVDVLVEVDLLQPDGNLQLVGYRVVEVLNTLAIAELPLRNPPQLIVTVGADPHCPVELTVGDHPSRLERIVEARAQQRVPHPEGNCVF